MPPIDPPTMARLVGFDSIVANDPNFNPDTFYGRVNEMFMAIQNAWMGKNMEPARRFLSDQQFAVMTHPAPARQRRPDLRTIVGPVASRDAERRGLSRRARSREGAGWSGAGTDSRDGSAPAAGRGSARGSRRLGSVRGAQGCRSLQDSATAVLPGSCAAAAPHPVGKRFHRRF